ncbi:MAG: hypothetical protein LLG02_08845 [Pelosinus sp.]|nr:hypothetical protein [Pelosinus sp.]
MLDINWLHFLILILAAFSVNYLIINEGSVYFSKKSYFSKWALCFIFSTVLVLLKSYVPSSFTYLLAFAVAGGVESINTLVALMQKRKDFNHEKEEEYKKILDITDEVFEYYQNQISALKNNENVIKSNSQNSNQASAANNINDKTGKINEDSPSKINVSVKGTKIINSDRIYGQQEFFKESKGQNIILSPYLRSNLDNSNTKK